ncbi:MAG: serine/threonine protein kinase [bacterium]|nr:serine/threonine protein kinase [bacterium]
MNICLSCEGVTATTAQRCGHCGAFLLPLDSVHYPARRGEADAGNPVLGSVVDGKYRLEGVLGRGGLGTVFQAEHVGSLMKVAVKLLHPRFSERPEYQKALLPEARRAATVTNERCARLLDVGETADGGTFLAMELVEGDTLDTLVKRGALAPAHAVEILVQIAEALVAIHGAGLVHCDLAPRNVMVSQRGGTLVAKVLDFGIARSVSITAGERLEHGEFRGFANPAFSAPEQLAGDAVDPRADLYSLGALAWFLLTGEPPIVERDSSRAARRAVAGELESWPGVAGVPRRFQTLIQSCLRRDPDGRPPSAAVVRRELLAIGGARRPALARTALSVLAVSVVLAVMAFFEVQEPFLRSVSGSPLVLRDQLPRAVLHLRSEFLETVQLRFGGFDPARLRLDVARGGTVLLQRPLRPEVDDAGGTLTLSVAQPEWRSALTSLLDSSRQAPVDLAFVVPGRAPLGVLRLRLDDDAPTIAASLRDESATALTAATVVDWRAEDAIGCASARFLVEHTEGVVRELPVELESRELPSGELAIGGELEAVVDSVAALPGAAIRFEVTDLAGNVRSVEVASLPWTDVRAPFVTAVTGPAGETALASIGGTVRLRVELSAREPGCELVVRDLEGREMLRRKLGNERVHDLEIAPRIVPQPNGSDTPNGSGQSSALAFESGQYEFEVIDRFGNRGERRFVCTVRDRTLGVAFLGERPSFATVGEELVIAEGGAKAVLRCSPAFEVRAMSLTSLAAGVPESAVEFERRNDGLTALTFHAVPAGRYRLDVELEERDMPTASRVRETVALRVLPGVIELRVATPASRFLSGLEQAGVLERSGDGYREGAGWSIDAELLDYVRGTLWTGGGSVTLAPMALPTQPSPLGRLLPELLPLPGHNVLGISLVDVLGRPVRTLVGDHEPPQRIEQGRNVDVVAEFYWHNQPPEPIGEELLVEHGQGARLRLRLPLPYEAADAGALRLSLSENELVASTVETVADQAAIATFDLPFVVWRAAARISDLPRARYAEGLAHTIDAQVITPSGRYPLLLTLRTTRSTLRTVQLGELALLDGEFGGVLAEIRLVPVLAPDHPFAEPVPELAPSRTLFRPQAAVAVRNMRDLVLQDRELTTAEVRAIVAQGLARRGDIPVSRLVHTDDPLGAERLTPAQLLPAALQNDGNEAVPNALLAGIDFFQAYCCCRLLGVALAGDPELFRLPMGAELELAAFGDATQPACNGAAAHGEPVRMSAFRAAIRAFAAGRPLAVEDSWAAGDRVPGRFGAEIGGLDFGVREWVGDLPNVPEQRLLLEDWIADHEDHLTRVAGFASGAIVPPPGLADSLRTFGVVRGLALGESAGLLRSSGQRLDPRALEHVPASVPGVLRTEQLRRDGRDLLSTRPDPRLQRIGFRVAGTAALIARMRGLE